MQKKFFVGGSQPTEIGTITFYHRKRTHDDHLWALALATYATKQEESEQQLFIAK